MLAIFNTFNITIITLVDFKLFADILRPLHLIDSLHRLQYANRNRSSYNSTLWQHCYCMAYVSRLSNTRWRQSIARFSCLSHLHTSWVRFYHYLFMFLSVIWMAVMEADDCHPVLTRWFSWLQAATGTVICVRSSASDVTEVDRLTLSTSNLVLSGALIGGCLLVSAMVSTMCCAFFWWQRKRLIRRRKNNSTVPESQPTELGMYSTFRHNSS